MKNNRIHIILSEYFKNQITFRSSLDFLKIDFDHNATIVFDFDDIKFISRSAAHELLSFIRNLDAKNIDYEFINMESEVKLMIDKVEQTLDKKRKSNTYVRKVHFNSQEDLNHYLESMEI